MVLHAYAVYRLRPRYSLTLWKADTQRVLIQTNEKELHSGCAV